MISLSGVEEGCEVVINSMSNDAQRWLSELGIYEGARVVVYKNDSFNPLIVGVGESRFGIDRGLLNRVYVA